MLLEKNFVLNKDYTKSRLLQQKQTSDSRGGHNKEIIRKCFTLDLDYKQSLLPNEKQTTDTRGGHNTEIFMLNIKTFKYKMRIALIIITLYYLI